MLDLIRWNEPSLWKSIACILFNPIAWNIVARREHRTRFLTKLCGGPYQGCYVLAFLIFTMGLFRDYLYKNAIEHQPTLDLLGNPLIKAIGGTCIFFGAILVVSSTWKLGITGTFLGDYFGILMNERVTSFPFNVVENPMYTGSTLNFLGTAIWYQCPAGLLLTLLVHVMYQIALQYEGPFTAKIYEARSKNEKKQS
ncbi:uncharacterized protein VTP21DRAFT_3478 [Calcarisporiella thermophila]|uniref:uncharacterized protein n=1 Tax=Calcarisporiella thermophila TaxID=911321 RepID=UPI003743EE50